EVLGLPFAPVDIDEHGRMSLAAIEKLLQQGDVGTIVATMGNTGLGAVDRLDAILEIAAKYDVRVHADAAYGGYFGLCEQLSDNVRASYDRLVDVDSIVVDPHKHGLQPYGCGCILFKDASVGQLYKHDSPFTYFSSAELHLGEISLECSRAGASAVALWATQKLFPLEPGGQFATWLDQSLIAAQDFWQRLGASNAYVPLLKPELDIVVYAVNAPSTSAASAAAQQVFERAAGKELHLAMMGVPAELVLANAPDMHADTDTVTCLRSVLMKPEHGQWLDQIMDILEECAVA
ncbi:MAG: pyridoxal-dependent decarboxylase, partial [Woeseiaceae bacterium]